MGWLGWTANETLATDVNCIMIAMEGKLEMLYPEEVKKKRTDKRQFADKFKQAIGAHNAAVRRRDGK